MSKNLRKLEEVNLSGIGHYPLSEPMASSPTSASASTSKTTTKKKHRSTATRTAKRQRVSGLEEELAKLASDDPIEAKQTLSNIYEIAKMSCPTDNSFYKDFHAIDGIYHLCLFLNNPQYLFTPSCLSTAAGLTYMCTVRGGSMSSDSAQSFVENGGIRTFLVANAKFLGLDTNNSSDNNTVAPTMEKVVDDDTNNVESRHKASYDIWTTLTTLFEKLADTMDHEAQMYAIDSILSTMDKLGEMTAPPPSYGEENNASTDSGVANSSSSIAATNTNNNDNINTLNNNTNTYTLKALHGAYRAMNSLLDHVKMTRQEIEECNLFHRCHAVTKTKPQTVTKWINRITKTTTIIGPATYRNDPTIFLNTKKFFVTCYQNQLLETKQDYTIVVPFCVETIKRNSSKASRNVIAQDRRHSFFDMMSSACKVGVDIRTIETSGILRAIELTLIADGTSVKSSSKEKARELLQEIVALM
jgi:hypothetical protein